MARTCTKVPLQYSTKICVGPTFQHIRFASNQGIPTQNLKEIYVQQFLEFSLPLTAAGTCFPKHNVANVQKIDQKISKYLTLDVFIVYFKCIHKETKLPKGMNGKDTILCKTDLILIRRHTYKCNTFSDVDFEAFSKSAFVPLWYSQFQ